MVALFIQVTSLDFLFTTQYKPDLILILVVWAGLRMTPAAGILFAFVSGILVDFLSGSPAGLFALIYCLVFVCCGYVNANFDMQTLLGYLLTLFVATIFAGGTVLLLRRSLGPVEFGLGAVRWYFLKSIVTGIAAVFVIPFVDRLWDGYGRLVGVR